MEIEKEIEVKLGEGYIVSRSSDGKSWGCILTRGTWNVIGTGAFFCYEHQARVHGVAEKCTACGEYALYLMGGQCAACIDAEQEIASYDAMSDADKAAYDSYHNDPRGWDTRKEREEHLREVMDGRI